MRPSINAVGVWMIRKVDWGVLHESAENQSYVEVDPSKFENLSDNEKEILEIWNKLSRNMRRELATAAESSVERDEEADD